MEPATVWSGASGEFSSPGVANIDDASSNLLVDASGNDIVDSGNLFTLNPATVWTTNDGDA